MRKGLGVIALLAGAAAIGLYLSHRSPQPGQSSSGGTAPATNPADPVLAPAIIGAGPATVPAVTGASTPLPAQTTNPPSSAAALPPPPGTPAGLDLGNLDFRVAGPPNMAIQTVLENARSAIRDYGSMFGGHPVGTNPEITAALNGNNPKQARFLQADAGIRINGNGEMVDPWGTPLFFHQISGSQTEIRSAGPDRKMWTGDDEVIK